jgi:hypothetical protein
MTPTTKVPAINMGNIFLVRSRTPSPIRDLVPLEVVDKDDRHDHGQDVHYGELRYPFYLGGPDYQNGDEENEEEKDHPFRPFLLGTIS